MSRVICSHQIGKYLFVFEERERGLVCVCFRAATETVRKIFAPCLTATVHVSVYAPVCVLNPSQH